MCFSKDWEQWIGETRWRNVDEAAKGPPSSVRMAEREQARNSPLALFDGGMNVQKQAQPGADCSHELRSSYRYSTGRAAQ